MRIIIESTDRVGVGTPVQEPTQGIHMETLDGGAPSEVVTQAITDSSHASLAREGTDGGSPPAWLMEAIQGATHAHTHGSGTDADAGSAPISEEEAG